MAEAAAEGATPLLHGLPDEIVLWEILVRLDPKSLLRCRAIRRAWRCATSTRRFLLAHHARQPPHPLLYSDGCRNILAFEHRSSQFHTVARLEKPFMDNPFMLEASCDGLLLFSRSIRNLPTTSRTLLVRLTIYNPATREHASVGVLPWDFRILGMYPHRPTGEYRLLLSNFTGPEGQNGCFVLPLGSDQPPRYIGWLEMVSVLWFEIPALIRDSLHWCLVKRINQVLVFDTTAESFRLMRAPVVPDGADLFEMDGTLGIHSICDGFTEIINIWMLCDYESEVWNLKYRIKLQIAEIREQFEGDGESGWFLEVVAGDGDMLLLVNFGGWLLHFDIDGKLIDKFDCGHRDLRMYECRLKQSLVQHTFFPALKGYAVSASPLI